MEDPRYWLLTSANEDNKIAAVQDASGMYVSALVDEQAGGVIGYLLLGEAQRIVDHLNAIDKVLDILQREKA